MLQIGSLVDNKYKILSEVGHGGMSVVYLAINERANKTWAVKEVRKDGVCDFEAVKQGLVVETDMLKKLNHPYLPDIIDVIDTEDSFLIVMDYIEGKSLQSVLKNAGAQPKDKVRKWAMQLCDVLGYLHSREPAIIYRDMKPANVMLRPTGDITLIDFGTAREFKNRAMVEDTTCLGTRGYAAPEQFGGRGQTDARTDIYCLGATMYHLITGHSPAEPPYEIKPLSYWDPAYYGTGLEQIINRCCQQDPEHRYQSCAELMYDLEHMDDMDIVVQRKRKQKWTAFVASVAMFGVGLAGIIGGVIGKNAAVKDTYDQIIRNAQGTANFQEYASGIQEAVEVSPGRYDAYDMLLTKIEQDGIFDLGTEWPALKNCLGYKGANEEVLLRQDQAGYADLQFRIGKLYFLFANDLESSVGYFERALGAGEMAQSADPVVQTEARIAEVLSKIGSSMESLKKNTNMFGKVEYSFGDVYADLESLIMNNGIDSFGAKQYGLKMYSWVANIILENRSAFKQSMITETQMLTLLDYMEKAINAAKDPATTVYDEMINTALNNISSAKQQVEGGAD